LETVFGAESPIFLRPQRGAEAPLYRDCPSPIAWPVIARP